ncbi:phosphate transport system substrate-binding protein [Friedmanniella endophytica]|uniref:Phosphate-binding protein n=1 Tax=Microlunatus kandeliicorticis TaxID=1759536 RepID=A0A7W3P7P5_9ACTN|nr:phosphate ABC transporter substrate-binding protein PstS [Microlunatus kandeliicorticis]MBA8796200.1 phosphate transport system substrate-binding protein [Microlunatus kandeliicorticis]
MNRKTLGRIVLPATLALSLGLTACGGAANEASSGGGSSSGGSSALSGSINGAGSSAQSAAMTAWIAGFQQANSGAQVNYDAVGSGAGVEQFTNKGVAFAGSDKYLTSDQLTAANAACAGGAALDIPTYVSPIAVAYNLKGVDDLQLSPTTLAGIFAGTITSWDDAAIKADNPKADLPSTKITPVHRSDKSGTTNNFTDYLNKTAPETWTSAATETWPINGGESAKGTSGVVAVLKGGDGTIGYADESQVSGLQTAKVKVGSSWNGPTADGAAKALTDSKAVSGRPDGDLVFDVNRTTTADGAYPVLLVSYEIFCTKYANADQAKLVKGLLTYIVSSEGQQAAAKAAGSAPLPSEIASKAKESVDKISTDS